MPQSVTKNVDIQKIRKGDVLPGQGPVTEIKFGPKWATVSYDKNGVTKTTRVLVGEELEVVRQEPTAEERKAAALEVLKHELAGYSVENYKKNADDLHAKLGGRLDGFTLSNFLYARAEVDLADWLHMFINDKGHLEGLRAFVDYVTEQLVGNSDMTRGLSRSTSVCSNLLNDVQREAYADWRRRLINVLESVDRHMA